MDGTFLAIATILHRLPPELREPRGKREAGTSQENSRAGLRDVPDGWIRVAL